jgi:hypothetical protein
MKIRNDFVTNSSSSSFIIALHKDAIYNDILEVIKKHEANIRNSLDEVGEDGDDDYVNSVIEDVASMLFRKKNNGMALGEWIVSSETYSSEGEIEDWIMYSALCTVDSNKLKVDSFC